MCVLTWSKRDKPLSCNKMRRIVSPLRALFLLILPFFLLTGSSLLNAAPASEETRSLTLDEAVRTGLEKSRTLEIARLDRDMAGQKIRESWSAVLPQITTGVTYTRTLKPSVLLLPPNQGFPTTHKCKYPSHKYNFRCTSGFLRHINANIQRINANIQHTNTISVAQVASSVT